MKLPSIRILHRILSILKAQLPWRKSFSENSLDLREMAFTIQGQGDPSFSPVCWQVKVADTYPIC